MLAVARRLLEGDALARSGQWTGWNLDQLCGADVWGKTLGILGFGRIGRAVARRAQGFGMRVIYNDTQRAPAEVEQAAERRIRRAATRCLRKPISSRCTCRCCPKRAA